MIRVLDKEIYIAGPKSCICGGTQYSCPPHELKFSSSSNIDYMSFITEHYNVLRSTEKQNRKQIIGTGLGKFSG